jgi:hypothetical protein
MIPARTVRDRLAAEAGVSHATVLNWYRRPLHLVAEHHLRLVAACVRLGVDLPDALCEAVPAPEGSAP